DVQGRWQERTCGRFSTAARQSTSKTSDFLTDNELAAIGGTAVESLQGAEALPGVVQLVGPVFWVDVAQAIELRNLPYGRIDRGQLLRQPGDVAAIVPAGVIGAIMGGAEDKIATSEVRLLDGYKALARSGPLTIALRGQHAGQHISSGRNLRNFVRRN